MKVRSTKKLTLDYIKSIVENNGYTLISSIYINNKTKMEMICPKGHFVSIKFNAFHNGDRCGVCAKKTNITIEMIKILVEKKNLVLLSETYERGDKPLLVKCIRDHIFNTNYNSLKNYDVKCDVCFRRTCRDCGIYKTLEEMSIKKSVKNNRDRICKICNNKRKSLYNKSEQRKKIKKEYNIRYRQNNREKVNKMALDWRNKNKEKVNIAQKRRRDQNIEKCREYDRIKFQKPNRKLKHKINQANRRAKKLKATPKWLTIEQLEEIESYYNNCPDGYHVDHIEPLRGKDICGLHVPWNLQYLTAEDNIKKGNRRK